MSRVERAIASYARLVAARHREVVRAGPFVAYFTPGNASPFLNYAIPDDGADPDPEDVEQLVATFRARSMVPRLEFIPGLAPRAEATLTRHGFIEDARYLLMTAAHGAPSTLELPPGIVVEPPADDRAAMELLTVQHIAFGESPPSSSDLTRLLSDLGDGAVVRLAREVDTTVAVGGGQTTVPAGNTAELVGIAVAPDHRRRGIGGALAASIRDGAFEAGVGLLYLEAAPGSERVYSHAGFVATGARAHFSLR